METASSPGDRFLENLLDSTKVISWTLALGGMILFHRLKYRIRALQVHVIESSGHFRGTLQAEWAQMPDALADTEGSSLRVLGRGLAWPTSRLVPTESAH